MIYLYRFDILPRDGVLSDTLSPFPASFGTLADQGRQFVYSTNYEEPIVRNIGAAMQPGLLKPGADASLSTVTFQPAAAISHSVLRLDGERASGEMSVRLHRSHAVAQLFAVEAPAVQVWLTVSRISGPADLLAPRSIFMGRVRSTAFDETMCTLTCMHLGDVLQRPGLTRRHGRLCDYMLYDQSSCRVNADATLTAYTYFLYREDGTAAAISPDGLTVTVPEAANRPDGFFNSGVFIVGAISFGGLHRPRGGPGGDEVQADRRVVGGIRRTIASHVGSTLVLKTRLPGNVGPSDLVWLRAGCDGSATTCTTKFSNYANHGGYPTIPLKNIFTSGLK